MGGKKFSIDEEVKKELEKRAKEGAGNFIGQDIKNPSSHCVHREGW